MNAYYDSCFLCPRNCRINRNAGERGFCGETAVLRAACASLHSGEEPPLSGKKGSGTIFITGCNLKCVFCQNYQISGSGAKGQAEVIGKALSPEDLAALCLLLEERGAANVNIVTGSHAAPAIAESLSAARKRGLSIPVLWNSSAYETTESLALLDGLVDIYLPDLKTLDGGLAERYFAAPLYPQAAEKAICYMLDKAPLKWEGEPFDSALLGGVIVRHLALPGELESTRNVMRWFAENAKSRALFSLMTQYTPPKSCAEKAPSRYINEREYRELIDELSIKGIDDGYVQELVRGSDWLPDFTKDNPFGSSLSVVLWKA